MARGRGEQLPGRTFSAPRKWMKGKGRITIQYGVCYSYAFPQVSERSASVAFVTRTR